MQREALPRDYVTPGLANGCRLCDEAVRCFATMGVEMVRTMVRRNDVPLLALFRSMGFVAGTFSELERAVHTAAPRELAELRGETILPEEEVA